MNSIENLAWTRAFVDALPGDPELRNYTRAVTGACWSPVTPTTVSAPTLLALVPEVAELLDLAPTPTPLVTEALAGNRVVPGMVPYAACYGGHQFGSWAGQLGDGRAITLGEVRNARGETWEMQLKGAGPTPYSRRADGRAVLRSSLRELVCSEAMHHLGVPTTRALSLVATGDRVLRDMFYDGRPALEPGAIVCRVAPSFLRFGSYEIVAARNDTTLLRQLVAFTIERFYPALAPNDVLGLLTEVARRTARMLVEWMRVGFVHGVMNTDNMSILGLTIDYGPYGWLDSFDANWTPNTTDADGRRYRFANQPRIAHWNLVQLARAFSPLLREDEIDLLRPALDAYTDEFGRGQQTMMQHKLGLLATEGEADDELVVGLMHLFAAIEIDMTLFYRALATIRTDATAAEARQRIAGALYAPSLSDADEARLADWLAQYRARLARAAVPDEVRAQQMNRTNPLYVPRNYLLQLTIDEVAAGNVDALRELMDVFRHPYDEQPGKARYAEKRPDWARQRAGCSMLSCSS